MTTAVNACVVMLLSILTCSCICGTRQPKDPSFEDCFRVEQTATSPNLDMGDKHGQGRELLGFGFMHQMKFVKVDDIDMSSLYTKDGEAIVDAVVERRKLIGYVATSMTRDVMAGPISSASTRHELTIAEWQDATFKTRVQCTNPAFKGRGMTVAGRLVAPAENSSASWSAFQIELTVGKKLFASACEDSSDVAFPLEGSFDDSGRYMHATGKLSFACTQKVVAKCITEKYWPDASNGRQQNMFQACTRMMRADYCGDGKPHTRDGTFYNVYDNGTVSSKSSVPPMDFEAAWIGTGAICMSRPRWVDLRPTCKDREIPPCGQLSDSLSHILAPTMGVLFNESCQTHPCTVVQTNIEELRDVARRIKVETKAKPKTKVTGTRKSIGGSNGTTTTSTQRSGGNASISGGK